MQDQAPPTPERIESLEQLEAIYGPPLERSLWKEVDHLAEIYRPLIAASPFMVVASVGPEGTDCSPRGDPAGFVRVLDEKRLAFPDRRGNNRLDTLRNIIRDPRVSLLFLIPGVGETLRVNGRAEIRLDLELRESFTIQGKTPTSVIVVTVDRVYFQCQKALARSKLWDPESRVERSTLPSAGDMAQMFAQGPFDGAAYDANYPEHMKKTIY